VDDVFPLVRATFLSIDLDAMAMDTLTKILVVGGGVAGLEAVDALQTLAPGRFDIELVTPQRHLTSRTMTAGPPFLRAAAERIEVAAIAAERGVRLTRDALELVEPDAHEVLTQGGARRSYDVLVLALGTRPAQSVDGAMSFRGLQDLAALTAALDTVTSVAYIVGSESMWTAPLYELAVQTVVWAADRGAALEVLVVTAERVDERLATRLLDAGVTLIADTAVNRFADGRLETADGGRVEVDLAVALPHLMGPAVRGMPSLSPDGFTVVDDDGRVAGVDDIYAVGDMTGRRVLAAQQASGTADAIAARAS
jgi:NADH dehydrogenase FAD-containing subunit